MSSQRPLVPCVHIESDVQHEGLPLHPPPNWQSPGGGTDVHATSPVLWFTGTLPPPLLLPLVEPPPLPLEELPPLDDPLPLVDPLLDPLVDPLLDPLVDPLDDPLPDPLDEPAEPLLDPLSEPASATAAAWPPQPHRAGRIAMTHKDLRMGEDLRTRARCNAHATAPIARTKRVPPHLSPRGCVTLRHGRSARPG
jgi:hypothetical protein